MRASFAVLILLLLAINAYPQQSAVDLLDLLKLEISHQSTYEQAKLLRIARLKKELAVFSASSLQQQFSICSQLFVEYKDFKFDSAYVYAQKLLQIAELSKDPAKQNEGRLNLGSIQLSGGMFKETFETLGLININPGNPELSLRYFALKSRALKDLARHTDNAFYSPKNFAMSVVALDSAIRLTRASTYENYKLRAERLSLFDKRAAAIAILRKLINAQKYTTHQRAMAANDLSYLVSGGEKQKLVTMAAIYDIRTSTKQALAMFTLGKQLFNQAKTDEAAIVLEQARQQAAYYGNLPRLREVSALLTQARAQQLISSENRKNFLLTILVGIAVAVLFLLAWFSRRVHLRSERVKLQEEVVRKRNLQLDSINKRLLEDAHIKEEYIGYFFNVISGYIQKIEKIKRNTERKFKAGDYQEVLRIAQEIDVKGERAKLFYTFDHIFLGLFPNFISTFNALLRPEDQIWPKENELLNTHLRIFALMRLGINDSQTVASILETAVSTVYTYKNRIKSKALIQGEDFDRQIMDVKFVDIS